MVFEKIREIIADQLEIEASEISMDTDIMNDLYADSLDAVEVICQVEEAFGIEIPDDETEQFRLVGNLVKFVEDNM